MWWGLVAGVGVWLFLASRQIEPVASIAAAIAAGLVAYWVDVQLHPYTSCWNCSGSPKITDHKGTSWRYCAICGGSGKRRRVLARRER